MNQFDTMLQFSGKTRSSSMRSVSTATTDGNQMRTRIHSKCVDFIGENVLLKKLLNHLIVHSYNQEKIDDVSLSQGHCEGAQCQMRSLWRRGSQHHCHDHCHHDCCQTLPETNSYKLSPSLRWSKHTKSSMNKTLTESSPRSSSFSPWRLLFSKFLKSSYYVYLLFYRTENPREN